MAAPSGSSASGGTERRSRSSRPASSRPTTAGSSPRETGAPQRSGTASDSGRLSAAELVDLLQISPAAVSGAVRYLSGLALVHKERVPSSRREYYRMPADIWHQVFLIRNQVLIRWSALLKEGIDIVGADTRAGQRMAGHAEFFEFLAAEMPSLMARWEQH